MIDLNYLYIINDIYFKIPVHKTLEEIIELVKVSLNLPDNPNILIIGPGLGVETIILKKILKNCNIEVIDIWKIQTYRKYFRRYPNSNLKQKYNKEFNINSREHFENNCKKYANFLPIIYEEDVFEFTVEKKYDLIYWDQGNVKNLEAKNKAYNLFNTYYNNNLTQNGYLFGSDFYFNYRNNTHEMSNQQLTEPVLKFVKDNNIDLNYDESHNETYWYVKKI